MKTRILTTLLLCVFTLGFSNQIVLSESSQRLFESNTIENDADVFYGDAWKGQTFTPLVSHTVTSIKLKLYKVGIVPGDVVVSIRLTNSSGQPVGSDLTSGSLACSSIKEGVYDWYEFSLDTGYDLIANTTYAIIWRAPDADTDNKFYFRINTSGSYPRGWVVGSINAGNTWGDLTNRTWDAVYEVWGEGGERTHMTIFVTPPISDEPILPTSVLPSTYTSNRISLIGCPGEYRPATFTLYTPDEVSNLTFNVADLISPNHKLSNSIVDIRTVKCWYQDDGGLLSPSGSKSLVPELLLKDDSLVKIEDGNNYLKMTSGEYLWISDPIGNSSSTIPTPSEFPVRDNNTLQPVDISAETNKQFWITVKIPDDAPAGTYTGEIELVSSSGYIGEIQLILEVLPFTLTTSMLEYSLYYLGVTSNTYADGTISHRFKSEQQLRAELTNMVNHGVNNAIFGCRWIKQDPTDWDFLNKLLTIRNEVGMINRPLYYAWLQTGNASDAAELDTLKKTVKSVIDFTRSYGVTDVYAYGLDEIYNSDLVLSYRSAWQAVHEVGGKILIAGVGNRTPYIDVVGDLVDILNNCYADANEPLKWHTIGKKIFCYNNPQVGEEWPATYRLNFGLLLWQRDYDGAMNYAYQAGAANIWNDFDNAEYRDHVFAYPTVNGVIDTVQWEGWREGVNDIRYLSTLIEAIEKNKTEGVDTSVVEAWLDELKTSNLSADNLDTIRSEMINHILSLGFYNQPSDYSEDNITANQSPENWDINGDGVANVLDMIIIGQRWGETGLAGWIKADTNKDGTINILDMIIIGQNWSP